jgi:hypothetical protein
MNKANDLTQDWPADPENAELERLAGSLGSAGPTLPAEALARIGERLQSELDRGERRQRWRRVLLGSSMAAAILLAVSGYMYWRGAGDHLNPQRMPVLVKEPEPIVDRVVIAVGDVTPVPAGATPLVRLDEHRSLFSD